MVPIGRDGYTGKRFSLVYRLAIILLDTVCWNGYIQPSSLRSGEKESGKRRAESQRVEGRAVRLRQGFRHRALRYGGRVGGQVDPPSRERYGGREAKKDPLYTFPRNEPKMRG